MRLISILAMALACTACQSPPNPMAPADATITAEPASNQPPCTRYTVPVAVGGEPEQAVVEACQQPDGSWRITQNTPGLPPQVYVVPAPTQYPSSYPYPDYYTYPSYYPYWAAEPWFFGLGATIVVAQRFPHFHHSFVHGFHGGFAHGFHGGFAHGLHSGFAHGFHSGFGGGLAAGHGGGGHR